MREVTLGTGVVILTGPTRLNFALNAFNEIASTHEKSAYDPLVQPPKKLLPKANMETSYKTSNIMDATCFIYGVFISITKAVWFLA